MKNGKKIVATIEARMTSTRLPGKSLMPLAGKPVLERLIERLRRSRLIDDVVVATTTNAPDDAIVELCERLDCHYWRGSEDDVLLRVLEAAEAYQADIIVETCGDSPLTDWRQIDRMLELFFENSYDFISNNLEPSFPIGFDVRIFPTAILAEVERTSQDPYDRENVSPYIYTHPEKYTLGKLVAEGRMRRRDIRLTLDHKEDYDLLNTVFEKLLPTNPDFSAEDVISLFEREPKLADINKERK